MKKITLSLLALSTIVSADLVVLKCSFSEHKDITIKIYQPQNEVYSDDVPGLSSFRATKAFIGAETISIDAGGIASVDIRRDTGAVRIKEFIINKEYRGICTKQSNAI